MMARPAFTIVEIIIVAMLLVALMGLAVPVFIARLRHETAMAGAADLGSAMVMARSIAEREGRIVELVAIDSRPRVRIIGREPAAGSDDIDAPEPFIAGGEADPPSASVPGDVPPLVEIKLPESVRIGRSAPWTLDRAQGPDPAWSAREHIPEDPIVNDLAETVGAEEFVVALFLPDGSVSAANAVYVYRSDERAVAVRVNRWTGAVHAAWEVAQPELTAEGPPARAEAEPIGARP